MPDNWFRRNNNRTAGHANPPSPAAQTAPATDVPAGLAVKCDKCGEIIFNKEFEKNLKVCLKCGHHHRLSAEDRIEYTVDEGTFDEFEQTKHLRSKDFLDFPDYKDKLEKGWKKYANQDSIVVGTAKIDGNPTVLGVSQFGFMGGSMGSVVGEKITVAIEEAIKRRLPVILFTTSGGARMQEGLMSLMQMAKTSAACSQLAQAGLPLIIILTDATTGGVMASFASLGDVLIGEPNALVAFAGSRVAAQAAQGQKLPANYQTSEWRVEIGQFDAVVHRRDMKLTLGKLLSLLAPERAPEKKPVHPQYDSSGENHNGYSYSHGTVETPSDFATSRV